MATGVLKGAFGATGFTFIAPGEHPLVDVDVFLHVTQLEPGEDPTRYARGAEVEYELDFVVRDGVEKPQARHVRLVAASTASLASVVEHGCKGRVKFWSPTGYGFVIDGADVETYVNGNDVPGGHLRQGDIVEFDIEIGENERRRAVNLRRVSWEKVGDPFVDQLDMGSPSWAQQLATLAENENWNYEQHPQKDRFVVLRSYMKYTFLRLNELPGHVVVSGDESALAFNTGLVTSYQEDIFAVFGAQPSNEGPPWRLRAFEKASSVPFLQRFGGNPPPLAMYFTRPDELVYDLGRPLRVNVEHVPHDPERFPEALKSLSPPDLAGLVNAKAPDAVHRVRRNYKTAIPQFYRDGKSGTGSMQLLLPVALLSRDRVELALAVERLDQTYLGRTVLPLDWAYNNARLLTRPDKDWLRP